MVDVWSLIGSQDGRGPSTALTAAVLKHLQVDTPMNIIPWIYNGTPYDRVAGLSPVVYETARAGDLVAQQIVHRGAEELAISIEVREMAGSV